MRLTDKRPPSASQRHLAVEHWVLSVSSHLPEPPSTLFPMPESVTYVSDDAESGSDHEGRQVTQKSKKRPRSDSNLTNVTSRDKAKRGRNLIAAKLSNQAAAEGTHSSAASDAGTAATNEVGRRSKTVLKRINAPDPTIELQACISRIQQSTAEVYETYEYPVINYESGDPPLEYVFVCKICQGEVARRIGTMETSSLKSHANKCKAEARNAQMLTDLGIVTTSLAKLSKAQVREFFALWVAENARPFGIVNDRQLRKLLHPDAVKYLPHRTTIAQEIKRMYRATQDNIRKALEDTRGVFHIALDMLQSDNGFDFLGIVLFRQVAPSGETITVKRFVLECLSFREKHTGAALARTVHEVLCKFGIQDRVWAVVCDNASNNGAMMDGLETFGLERLKGPRSRVHCVLHILNLGAQAVLLPFRKKRQELAKALVIEDGDDDDCDEYEYSAEIGEEDEADVDLDDDGEAPSRMLANEDDSEDDGGDGGDNEEEEEDEWSELNVPEIVEGSEDDTELRTASKVLWKVAMFARKIRYNPAAKAAFKGICVEKKITGAHNVPRDVAMRWNSTEAMLAAAVRCFDAIISFQRTTKFQSPGHRLSRGDRDVMKRLLSVLSPLHTLTNILSRAGVPMLADIIVHYDILDRIYLTMAMDVSQPLYVRHAADRARKTFNKYYQKTDESDLYRIAILLHPSLRVNYLKKSKWPADWIETAIEITEDCWRKHYQLEATTEEPETDARAPRSAFEYTSYFDDIFGVAAETDQASENPVRKFVNAPILLDQKDSRPVPYNPLVWWHGQRAIGNEHHGITQMALDVLSIPASSVDVERAFSFVGSMVTKRRHSLKPCTIEATASLGCYSKAGLVREAGFVMPRKAKKAKAQGVA